MTLTSCSLSSLYLYIFKRQAYNCNELPFKLKRVGGERDVTYLIPEINSISLKLNKINYLNLKFGTVEHQMVRYSLEQCDVTEYITRGKSSSK